MLVEIYSDVVCPWCYIGKRRFESALAKYPRRDEITVVWKPHQLDPTAPRTPSPVVDSYAKKFGGPERAREIIANVTQMAAGEGLEFNMDRALRANTLDAHRVIHLAGQLGGPALQDAVKERLLQAYFTDGRDVASRDELVALAGDAGLDRERVAAMLDSDELRAEVRDELLEGLDRGVTAVPTFVFDGQWSVPGAQDPEVFLRVLSKLMPEVDPSLTCEGDACEVAPSASVDAG